MHKKLGQTNVQIGHFINLSELKDYLVEVLNPDERQRTIVVYKHSGLQGLVGHAVCLKAKKLRNGEVSFKVIDFQLDPDQPRKYYNKLPDDYTDGDPIYFFDNKIRYRKPWNSRNFMKNIVFDLEPIKN